MLDPNQPHSIAPTEPGDALLRPTFFIPLAKPLVTQTLIVCNLIFFVVMIVYGYVQYQDINGSQNMNVLIDLGAKVNAQVANGAYWRLLTAMFMHIGVIHLLFNLYALYAVGSLAEGYFGHARYAVIYLVAGLFGSAASYAHSDAVSAGASGAIFGLTGAVAIYLYRYRENFGQRGRMLLQNMFMIIAVNLAFGYMVPGIDNWGHLGGLVGGSLLAWGLLPRYQPPEVVRLGPQPMRVVHRIAPEALWTLVCVAALAAFVSWTTISYLSG